MLEKQKRGFARLNREILLHLFPLLTTEGRICEDHVIPVFFLNIGEVFRQRVRVELLSGDRSVDDVLAVDQCHRVSRRSESDEQREAGDDDGR